MFYGDSLSLTSPRPTRRSQHLSQVFIPDNCSTMRGFYRFLLAYGYWAGFYGTMVGLKRLRWPVPQGSSSLVSSLARSTKRWQSWRHLLRGLGATKSSDRKNDPEQRILFPNPRKWPGFLVPFPGLCKWTRNQFHNWYLVFLPTASVGTCLQSEFMLGTFLYILIFIRPSKWALTSANQVHDAKITMKKVAFAPLVNVIVVSKEICFCYQKKHMFSENNISIIYIIIVSQFYQWNSYIFIK